MAVPRFLANFAGRMKEVLTIATSAGAADAEKVPSTNANGYLDPSLLNAKDSSAGAADAFKVPLLDSSGRLSPTMMPSGIGANTKAYPASEALAASDLVNVWSDAGTAKVRKADATAEGKEVAGFVLEVVGSGGTATVYFEGTIAGLSGLTPGARMFLSASTPGSATSVAPSASGNVVQVIGTAVSATEIDFERSEPITKA